ncbi:MAG: hypothetical protein RIR70_1365 [Pseudomonadota bacterium]|jgi:2-C-methyl-D-erythritol 4-phosphate cytidylyltransferase
MTRYFALIPAAGSGLRMGQTLPKQYAPLAGKPLVGHCLATLQAVPKISGIFVVIAPEDSHWRQATASLDLRGIRVLPVGGASRAASVANGLDAIADTVAEDDWVLVHDAARACLSVSLVERLIESVGDHPVGGLLAVPLADTLKRADTEGAVAATVPRAHLWQAQTPQMFRFSVLREALARADEVTDESSAIEALGHRPLLVEGDARNFKVTRAPDLLLAQRILEHD